MVDNEDWLYRPVIRGLIKGESLFDGSLNLANIAMLNEAITVQDENAYRAQKAAEARAARPANKGRR